MAECHAIGTGIVITEGACNPAGPSLDDAVKALERAIEDAERQASADCPQGTSCQGVAVPVGPPTCGTQNIGGKPYCLCTVTVALDGECAARPGGGGAAPAPVGGQVIEGDDIRDFFRKVEQLPDLPKNPQGPCRMYRQQRGHGFYYPICAGSCDTGKCRTIVEVIRRRVRARCECK